MQTSRPRRRWLVLGALGAVLLLILVFAATRVHVVTLPAHGRADGAEGTVFLLIGTDAGIPRPAGDIQETGTRADVVVLVHVRDGDARAVVVPRDLVVTDAGGAPLRLALAMQEGAPAVADGLCRGLGVTVDHLVAVDATGFPATVDALGGLRLDIPHPVRDPAAGLELRTTGVQLLDGAQALALVRSRHPEYLVDGEWMRVSDEEGARIRAASTADVAAALSAAVRDADGLAVAGAAWQGSRGLTVSWGTTPWGLQELIDTIDVPVVLPTDELSPGFEIANDETAIALADAGFPLGCGAANGR